MTDLMPKFCPHCLADFSAGVEVKTSNPPKCGVCLLPLWWEDRSGKTPDRPWPSYEEVRAGREARPLVYLACPYSHDDRAVRVARFEAANVAASALMRGGLKVFSPISHTHPIAEAGGLPLGWDFWEAFDRAYIGHSCKVIVLRVDGWRESKGVQAEIRIAAEYGIPVEYIDPAALASPSVPTQEPLTHVFWCGESGHSMECQRLTDGSCQNITASQEKVQEAGAAPEGTCGLEARPHRFDQDKCVGWEPFTYTLAAGPPPAPPVLGAAQAMDSISRWAEAFKAQAAAPEKAALKEGGEARCASEGVSCDGERHYTVHDSPPSMRPAGSCPRAAQPPAPPAAPAPLLRYCDADCTIGPEGGSLHSVKCQRRRAGTVKTCPVCGEERHGGTCIDPTPLVPEEPKSAAPAPTCTGLAAVWCPVHGDCKCAVEENGERSLTDRGCPLHSPESTHSDNADDAIAAAPAPGDAELAKIEQQMHEYYNRPAADACFCGRNKLRPGTTLIDKAWCLHRATECRFKDRPPNATDLEWADVLCRRAVLENDREREAARVRSEAIEACAKIADSYSPFHENDIADGIASSIRASDATSAGGGG